MPNLFSISPDLVVTMMAHMLEDARPVVILTRGQDSFRDLPVLDVLTLPEGNGGKPCEPPSWLDDLAHLLDGLRRQYPGVALILDSPRV